MSFKLIWIFLQTLGNTSIDPSGQHVGPIDQYSAAEVDPVTVHCILLCMHS